MSQFTTVCLGVSLGGWGGGVCGILFYQKFDMSNKVQILQCLSVMSHRAVCLGVSLGLSGGVRVSGCCLRDVG